LPHGHSLLKAKFCNTDGEGNQFLFGQRYNDFLTKPTIHKLKLMLKVFLIFSLTSLLHDAAKIRVIDADLQSIKDKLLTLLSKGEYYDILEKLQQIEGNYGHLAVDKRTPSFFNIKGVALHSLFKHELAIEEFKSAVKFYPNETRAWINLGDSYQVQQQIPEAIKSFEFAWRIGDMSAGSRLLSAKGWSNDW